MEETNVETASLPLKQQRFVEEFTIDFNGTAAARRAGYKAKSNGALRVQAYELLTKPNIQGALRERITKLTEHADETTKRLIQETMRLTFSDIRKLFDENGKLKPIHEIDDDTAACISSVKVTERYEGRGEAREFVGYEHEYKLWDKHPAMDKLFRYMALYKDLGTKDNPLNVLHKHIDLSTLSVDELAQIRDNPDYARSLLTNGR